MEGYDDHIEYIAHRLGWNKNDIERNSSTQRHLQSCSHSKVCFRYFVMKIIQHFSNIHLFFSSLFFVAEKIKEHLDFLLNEAQFDGNDIPKCLKVFNKSIDELRARFGELTAIGIPITIQGLLKTKTDYLKYVQLFCDDGNEEHQSILLTIEKRSKSSSRKKSL